MIRKALLAFGWIAGCAGAEVKTEAPQLAGQPVLEIRGIAFNSQGFTGLSVTWRFELKSRDVREAALHGCPYRFEPEGLTPVTGRVSPAAVLPAQGTLAVEASAALPWPASPAEISGFLSRRKIPYKFVLECALQQDGIALGVTAADAGSIPLPVLPALAVSGANAERFGDRDIRVNFELSFVNDNGFAVRVDRIRYRLELEGRPMIEGEILVGELIPASNEVSYDIATPILSGKDSDAIKALIGKAEVNYRLDGTLVSGDLEIPVAASGTIRW